jgi:hypothetical protein
MRDLLGGSAPLRGRAKLELVLQPFWYREAASFWQLTDDPELAFRVHALLGGTPAYRAMAFGPPPDRKSFDHWVVQRLLNPASALFREGNLLLREESGLTDPAPYHGALAAIAAGAARRSEIAGRVGRPRRSRGHEIDVVVVETPAGAPRRVVAIGEVTSTVRPLDVAAITRLEHLRELLPASQVGAPPRLLLFSRAGFTVDIRRMAASRHDVELVDLDRLYRGD